MKELVLHFFLTFIRNIKNVNGRVSPPPFLSDERIRSKVEKLGEYILNNSAEKNREMFSKMGKYVRLITKVGQPLSQQLQNYAQPMTLNRPQNIRTCSLNSY